MFTAELNWVEVLHTCCCGFGVFWLTTKFTPPFFFNFTIFFFSSSLTLSIKQYC